MTTLHDPALFAILTTLLVAGFKYFRPDLWMLVPDQLRSLPQLVIAALMVGGTETYRQLTGIGLELHDAVRTLGGTLLLAWWGSIGVYEAQKNTFPTAMQRLKRRRPAIPRVDPST